MENIIKTEHGPFYPSFNNDEQLANLVKSLEYSQSFALFFAVSNDNSTRKDIIEKIITSIPAKTTDKIEIYQPVKNLYHLLRNKYSEGISLPDITFVYGLEAWLTDEIKDENIEFIGNLNTARDYFKLVLKGPMVLWLSESLLDTIAKNAADLFSVRSGIYYFSPQFKEKETVNIQSAILSSEMDDVAGLDYDRKLEKIPEIQKMIEDYNALPEEHKSDFRYKELLQSLANVYYSLNMFDKAEPLLRTIVDITEKLYGKEHEEYARVIINLASLLQTTNHFTEAETLMRRAIEIDEKSIGNEHPSVARDLNNLSTLLIETNRYSEAELLMRQALDIDEKSLGEYHVDVARDLNNLAGLLIKTNRLSEAEDLLKRGIKILEKYFGNNHPYVATSIGNLALLLQDKGQFSEAEHLMRRALEIDEISFGKEHPKVARDLNNLAGLLKFSNHFVEAQLLQLQALEIFRKSYGDNHPYTLTAKNNHNDLLEKTKNKQSSNK